MTLKNERILVTGGAGFIGSHLVDVLLAKGNEVVVLDNFLTGRLENLPGSGKHSGLKIIKGDVRSVKDVEQAVGGCSYVFHLATHCVRLSLNEPMINHEVNATGTLNVLIAAKKNKVRRFLYCSSSEVFGDGPRGQDDLYSEESIKKPTTVYGASKLTGEYYTEVFNKTYGLETVIARPFNSYGPRSHILGPYGELIPRFAVMIMAGKQPTVFGDGSQTRDFTYVTDTATCLMATAENDKLVGESINLAHGEQISVLSIASMLYELSRRPKDVRHLPDRPGDIRRLGADVTKAHRFGITAKISIKEGLGKYLEWLGHQGFDYKELAAQLIEQNWKTKTQEHFF